MTPERWPQTEALLHAALALEPGEQAAFLMEACAGDEALRQELESLLKAHQEAAGFMELPALEVAAKAMAEGQARLRAGREVGHFKILSLLGSGGMGEVYLAEDRSLGRKVALKLLPVEFTQDKDRVRRLKQEARAASALNHPNIITVYEIGETEEGHFIATEFIDGRTLRQQMAQGVMKLPEALEIASQVAAALGAAHQAGIVHRDIKPENIMLRTDGLVKVLDFGLAKLTAHGLQRDHSDAPAATTVVTVPGMVMGTLAYLSPEQARALDVDARTDVFSLGIVMFEMISGQFPFEGATTLEVVASMLHQEPAPLARYVLGVPDELERIVSRALNNNREERYPTAQHVLLDLRRLTEELEFQVKLARTRQSSESGTAPRPLTRLIVLPFRILRQHEATNFLAVSLPDAITSSLAGIDSLVVRSTLVASRLAELDINSIARQAQVDAILTGTILADGERLRVATQLVEAPEGAVLWCDTSQVSLRDIFQLQDDLVDRIVQSLRPPLTDRERRALKHDVPVNADAYELYLRANQLASAGDVASMIQARDLYLRCVNADAAYAPAWACLGRTRRFLAKYGIDTAENFARADDAFRTAFALHPDLALAHNFYTPLEADLGRSLEAMERLLKRAQTHRNDPNLLTGLVQACRYCDLLGASVAAHDRAGRLDPYARTSVAWTYLWLEDFQRALDYSGPLDLGVKTMAWIALGREEEGIREMRRVEKAVSKELALFAVMGRTWLERDRRKCLEFLDQILELIPSMMDDPESRFTFGCLLADLNQPERALEFLSLALEKGYRCHYALLHDRYLAPLRSHHRFQELVSRAAALSLEARTVFLDNGGDRLLEVKGDSATG